MPHIIDNEYPYGLRIGRKNYSVVEHKDQIEGKVPVPPVVPEDRKTLQNATSEGFYSVGGFHQNAEEEDQYSFQGSLDKSRAESIEVHQVANVNINSYHQQRNSSEERKMEDKIPSKQLISRLLEPQRVYADSLLEEARLANLDKKITYPKISSNEIPMVSESTGATAGQPKKTVTKVVQNKRNRAQRALYEGSR